MKWQKCAGISNLWVINEIFQKKYPENMKKIWKVPVLEGTQPIQPIFTKIGMDWPSYLAGNF